MDLRNSKIDTRHLERIAVVYVRQSTTQQTIQHTESTRLQYGLTERALSLGWPRDRIVVIDDDLGRSGATAEGRPGFQRLVADVGLDHVGLILGIEMSRLARSCRDWYQLLEVCSIFRTLIADLDGVYDPANYNDRLLLGLKGTMSEAELHVMRQRLDQGRRNKAQRGELELPVPIGYVRKPSGEVIQDPDEHVRAVVYLVFEQFERRGTVNAVLTHLVRNGAKMPIRLVTGVNKGDIEWRRPNRTTLQQMLKNPIYAGAYAFGRTWRDARKKQPGQPQSGTRRVPREEWPVLLKDRIPAYITWEQYEANLAQMEANRPSVMGAPRRGAALLSGLITCGKCGRRMSVIYGRGQHRYDCNAQKTHYGAESCVVSMGGRFLDEHIAQLVMKSLEPAALEVSLEVAANLESERRRLNEEWGHRLERAQFEVDRAFRQYNIVEPENRLVVRTLERQLEEKMAAQRKLQEEHHRFLAEQPTLLTEPERAEIRALAADLPALWNATTTTPADKQTIIRQLVERVRIKPQGTSEKLDVLVEWIGGHRTQLTLHRPVWRVDQLTYHRDLIRRMRQLHDDKKLCWRQVADELNTEGWIAPRKRGFTSANVRSMASKHGLTKAQRPKTALKKHERPLTELAFEIKMPTVTLMSWARRGWITARKLHEEGRSFWIVSVEPKELAKIRAMRTGTTARRSALEMARA